MQAFSNEIVKEQKLTIGLDLGDRWSFYCVLDEAGKIILEQKAATTPEAMKQTFGRYREVSSPWRQEHSRHGKPAVNRTDTKYSWRTHKKWH
jgi:predicted NBD/HSP70 family sugar kinase